MLFKLIASVEALWKSADVVGWINPAIQRTISPVLKPTIVL
jgi:hypothetical protein